MKNFLKIGSGIDTSPLLLQLHHNPQLWDAENVRKTFMAESPHREVSDILLRFSDPQAANIGDELVCEDTPAMNVLFEARNLVFPLMTAVRGVMLGRVMITKLPPGGRIYPHTDLRGRYANTYRRFHLPLQSAPGCIFRADDEEVFMRPGEAWDFNAHAEHEVVNNSPIDRIHLIVDIRT